MRKRILAVVFMLAVLVGGHFAIKPRMARAQNSPNGLTMGTTVTASTAAGANYFYLLLSGGNVTTFSFSNPAVQTPGIVTVVFQQDSTGSRTVGWATNILSTPTITSTANKYTVVQFFYDSASQGWYTMATAHN